MGSEQWAACGQTAATGTPLCQKIYGPEFEFYNAGDCATGDGKIFAKMQCRRAQNTARTVDCCLNTTTGNRSCAPKSDINNGALCNASFQEICKSNPFSTTGCANWVALQPAAAASIVGNYCNTAAGLGDQRCRDWCRKNGGCDTGAQGYCATKPTGDGAAFCACLNSTSERAECFDNACTTNGYRTTTMRNGTDCGTLVNCVQNWNVSGDTNTLTQNQAIQNCTKGILPTQKPDPAPPVDGPTTPPPIGNANAADPLPITPPPTPPPTTPPPTDPTTPPTTPPTDNKDSLIAKNKDGTYDWSLAANQAFYAILTVLVFIVVLGGGFLLFRSRTPAIDPMMMAMAMR